MIRDSRTLSEATVATGYDAVMEFARDHPKWLYVVKACFDEAKTGTFAGSYVYDSLVEADRGKPHEPNWFPSLQMLARRGIVEKAGKTVRGGSRANYTMPDRNGVGRALRALGLLLVVHPPTLA